MTKCVLKSDSLWEVRGCREQSPRRNGLWWVKGSNMEKKVHVHVKTNEFFFLDSADLQSQFRFRKDHSTSLSNAGTTP